LGLLGFGNSAQKSVEEYMVIHTDHSLNPLVTPKTFGSANAFAGDLPYTYLNLYSQAELTITDRIHAALVTLAYGRPAYLVTSSGRASIIERIAGQDPTRGPILLDLPQLELEKKLQADFLQGVDLS
ncbi:MAG: polysaccharide pyruvyl transferase family protein, partial [Caldilineaceae bacterium]